MSEALFALGAFSNESVGSIGSEESRANVKSRGQKCEIKLCALSKLTANRSKAVMEDIYKAVKDGQPKIIEKIITNVKSQDALNELDEAGFSALHHSARFHRTEAVRLLLEHGCDVDVLSAGEGLTPLHIVSRFGWTDTTSLLLEHGANVNRASLNGSTALHNACRRGHKGVLSSLLSTRDVIVDSRDRSGVTPLHLACNHGNAELCEMLLAKGADIALQASDKTTPLHSAVSSGNVQATLALLSKAAQSKPTLEFLITSRDIDNNTVLHAAVAAEHAGIVELLIQHGASVTSPKRNLTTPLHMACSKKNVHITKLILDHGGETGARDDNGRTPLHIASMLNNCEVIDLLADKGAELDPRDFENRTPLLTAAAAGQTESVQHLLQRGSEMLAYDVTMKNCLHLAIEGGHVDTLMVLLEHAQTGAGIGNLYSGDSEGRVPLHCAAMHSDITVLQVLLRIQSRLNFHDENHRTPLHLASEAGRVEQVEALGTSGSMLNERDEEGNTALHLAAANGNRKVCRKLVSLGADVNSRNNDRWSPLMFAATAGSAKTCTDLLDSNANLDDVNNKGNSSLLLAASKNHVTVVKMLLDRGASTLMNEETNVGVMATAVQWGAEEVVTEICRHHRWRETVTPALSVSAAVNPMELLIKSYPEAASTILNRCIQRSSQKSISDPEYTITYDFHLLDPGPDDPAALRGHRYFGPLTMVKFARQDLLDHPLTKELLDRKWRVFGRSIFMFNFVLYVLFTALYTYFLVTERENQNFLSLKANSSLAHRNCSGKVCRLYGDGSSTLSGVLANIIMTISLVHLVKEILQMGIQRCYYFKQRSNFVEIPLYYSTVVFMIPYVAPDDWVRVTFGELQNPHLLWICGVFSILLCYMNLVLYLKRFRNVGIYVSMFEVVLNSLCRVLAVFSVFIVAFAVVFFILFKEQESFSTIGHAILKVTVMMIGEIDFVSTFVETEKTVRNPFPIPANIFAFIFMVVMSLALMNLLVGLAVGDIDAIQRDATMKRLSMQVRFVAEIEEEYPRWITRRIYNPVVTVKPNSPSLKKRMLQRFRREQKFHPTAEAEAIGRGDTELSAKVRKANKRLKTLMSAVETQNRLLAAIAKHLNLNLECMLTEEDSGEGEIVGTGLSDHAAGLPEAESSNDMDFFL